MKNDKKRLISVFIAFLLLTGVVSASEVVVIVNSSNSEQLSLDTIKNIYSDRVITWSNGNRIEMYNLPAGLEAAEIFSRKVLGLSAQAAVKKETNRKITNNLKNPSKTKSERLVVSFVSRKRNAIGYVPKYLVEDNKNIRIVATLEGD